MRTRAGFHPALMVTATLLAGRGASQPPCVRTLLLYLFCAIHRRPRCHDPARHKPSSVLNHAPAPRPAACRQRRAQQLAKLTADRKDVKVLYKAMMSAGNGEVVVGGAGRGRYRLPGAEPLAAAGSPATAPVPRGALFRGSQRLLLRTEQLSCGCMRRMGVSKEFPRLRGQYWVQGGGPVLTWPVPCPLICADSRTP